MRKVLWSLSLLVLLLNTLLTPITYAWEYEEIVEIIGDNGTEDVVEENEEEESSSEFSVEEEISDEENEEENIEEEEEWTEETEDDEITTWDVAEEWTWDTEEIETKELTWENEELTGEVVEAEIWTWTIAVEWTWYAEGTTWDTEELTWWVVEDEIGTWAIEEIVYNKESIIWERTYNDVTVKVEALSWIFPEWTELKIEPIKWWNLSNLKDKLVEEQAEVNEDTTVVAFDITFIYSWEEVQPKEWEKVKVTFDYSNNEDLVEADKTENQEVKVYHIEDKDEEWNELEKEEQKITDVTNKEESEEEWIAVADAESFSIYVLALSSNSVFLTLNPNWGTFIEDSNITITCDQENETQCIGTIIANNGVVSRPIDPVSDKWTMEWWYTDEELTQIFNFDNPITENITLYAKWICNEWYIEKEARCVLALSPKTIQEQNPDFTWKEIVVLRPTELTDTETYSRELYVIMDRDLWALKAWIWTDAYWYYYQFWNNYWFTSSSPKTTMAEANVDLSQYSPSEPYYSWTFVKWVQGGSQDWATTSNDEIWWGEYGSEDDRQWPCPNNWHVPTVKEWNDVIDYWTLTSWWQWKWVINKSNSLTFRNDLKLPLAWEMTRSKGTLDTVGSVWNFRTTMASPNVWPAYALKVTTESKELKEDTKRNRVNWYSVRCFKNLDSSVTYKVIYTDWTGWNIFSPHEESGLLIWSNYPEFDASAYNILSGENKRTFLWWYDEENQEVDISISKVTKSITLKAKWSKCWVGEIEDENGDCLITAKWQRLRQIVQDLDIYFLVNSWNMIHYTMMDRNMWATNYFDKNYDSPNPDSLWYLYQWWNNYWFQATWTTLSDANISSTGTQVSKAIWSFKMPSKYDSMVYVAQASKDSSWMKDWSNTDNIWWWWSDTTSLNWSDTTLTGRQWPCPEKYHVPSTLEWKLLYTGWNLIKTKNLQNFASDLLLPPVWRRDGAWGLWFTDTLSYRSSSPYTITNSRGFYWRGDDLQYQNSDWRARARSVRCVKNMVNTWAKTIEIGDIHLNWWTKVFISIDSGVILSLWTPTLTSTQLSKASFTGWYTTPNFKEESRVIVWQTIKAWSSLYAKYECKDNTKIWNWSDCVTKVSLSLMDGEELFDFQEIPLWDIWLRPEDPESKPGLGFDNWYTLPEGWEVFDFDIPLTSDTIAYAHRFSNEYTITTWSNDENMGTILVEWEPIHGSRVVFRAIPRDTLYKFIRWELNWNIIKTWDNEYWTGDLVIESLTWSVNVTWYFEDFKKCNLPWWGKTWHWSIVTGYLFSSEICPVQCSAVSQTATCNDGNWSVIDFETTYIYSGCTTQPVAVDQSEYPLNNCPAHWICDSMTEYVVNDNMCGQWVDRFKLVKCDEWYYEDNDECVANEYSVIFDANWGEWTMAQDTATYGRNYTIKNSNFTREWSTFSWWNTKTDKSWIRYYSWETILWNLTGNLTLYAQWVLKTYTVTYDAASHSWTINNQPTSWVTAAYNTEITLPTSWTSNIVSQKSWYQFIWWTREKNWTTPIQWDTYLVTEDVTFYPIFKKEKVEKDVTFHVNNNSWYVYSWKTYTEDSSFSGCSIPTLYNTDPYIWSCEAYITLPDIIADNNTPIVLWWSTWADERTNIKGTWLNVIIRIPGDEEVDLYAQTKAEGKTYTATYERDSRVEEVTKEPDTCDISETYNGKPQAVECAQAIILPAITAKTGYNTPVWKLGETTYEWLSTIHLSWNVIFTGTATPDQQTLYVVKHYYQRLEWDNIYQLSWTDNLSWATETNLDLSTLQLNPSSIPWFTYRKARVNSGTAETIDITSIQDQDFTNQGEIQPGLVIQLFYTRKNSPVTLHQIEGATVEKTPQKDSYYYGEIITFSGHAESGYTFSWWDIREWENATWRREWNRIDYIMTSTGVNVTPVIREHKYTIHYNASWAVGTIADRVVNYSEVVKLPTGQDVAEYYTYTWHHFVWWTTWDALITELTKATPVDNGEITLNAKWEENDWVTYSVEHYLEPIAKWRPHEEYELKDTYDGTAPQWTTVTWALNNYPWFEKPAEQWIVLTDDGLVIKYYYTRNSYNYTFNAWEWAKFSSWTTSEVVSFRYQQEVAFPATLIKTWFTQNGWEPALETAMPAENKTTTAQWTENQYTIKYNANWWEWTTPSQTVKYTENIALTWNVFIKTWYAFTWWSTTAQWPVVYKDKDTVHELTGVDGATVNLYAQWSAEKYVVTFDANSWVVAQTTGEVIYDQTYGTLPTPTRDGYEFTGWYTAKVWWVKVTSSTEVKTANDHTLYAHWEVNTYKVTLNPTGWEVTPTEITVTYDAQYGDLPTPTAIGYRFAWWYTDTAEPTLVTATTKVTIASNHTLKAHWYINHYSIEFNANEWVWTMDTITNIAYTGSVTLPANAFAREGYEFKWWSRTPNWVKEFDDEQTVTKLTWDNEVTVILYAVWSINKYTVTWKSSTWTVLKEEILPYWATPDYWEIPTSWADAQYTYTFKWWEPEIAPVTEDQVYTATYNQTVNTYTIRFVDEDWTELYTSWVAYWTTPVYSWVEPTKENTAQYTYTFNWWTPTLAPVTWEAIYTATYTETTNKYTITFVDEDWTELKAWEEYEYWTASWDIVQPDEPSKAPTPQTGYTFAWWTPTLTGVTEDQVYTATYSQTVNSYPITFYDEDGTTIIQWPTQYPYWTLTWVIVPIGTPTKASDGTYTYEFEKWMPELKTVVGTADYRATYKGTYIEYEVTFLDSTWAVLTSRTYHSWETVDEPAWPAKASTDQTGYTFTWWYPEVEVVTWDITYRPTYTETTRTYTIIWNNRDGTELYRDKDVAYWTHLWYTWPVPTKTWDAQYTYTYNWWMPTVHNVTWPQVYTATYSQTTNSYPITWKNENGTEIKTTQVLYWVTPSYTWPTPTKEWYSFDKWTPDLEPVVWTASYTASYIINSYNITPVKWVWVANIIWWWSYPYNSTVTLTWIAKEWYHFEWWVSEKAFTYTVPSHDTTLQISAEPNKYYIHFNWNGWVWTMEDQEFTYDEEQSLAPNVYTYNWYYFMSWTDGNWWIYKDNSIVKNLATTWVVTLIAQWWDNPWPTPPGPTPWPTPTPSWWWSWWSWGWKRIDKDTQEHASAEVDTWAIEEIEDKEEKNKSEIRTWTHNLPSKSWTTIKSTDDVQIPATRTQEEMDAYKYAYKYWITTLAPKEAAMPDAYVIRWHMAKMVVNYALNVLHRKLPAKMPKQCKWKDGRNAWESQEIKEYAEKACALWLMWIDMEYFQPNKLVTRAQFWTIFGRLLWWKIVSKPYYAGHLARLRKRWIMTQIDRPEERIEVRKWAWLMFMRSEKYFKIDK